MMTAEQTAPLYLAGMVILGLLVIVFGAVFSRRDKGLKPPVVRKD